MARNIWLKRKVQIIVIVLFVTQLFESLSRFRYYSSLRLRFGQKFFYCLVMDRWMGALVFLLKASLAYDPYLNEPFKKAAFDPETNEVVINLLIVVTTSVWGVFFLFKRYFEAIFLYQLLLLTLLMVSQVWLIYYTKLRYTKVNDQEQHIKRVLCGWNKVMDSREKTTLQNLGYRVTKQIIGVGTYGTTYKCGLNGNTDNNMALKVIDINEWLSNRTPSRESRDNLRVLEKIRIEFMAVVPKLRTLDHKNVVKYEKIHNERGTFKRIYLIIRMAEMNLDTFLSQYRPNGVSEGWARNWFQQVCRGLFYLHEVFESEPFPHSNIKPENILLYRKDESDMHWESNSSRFRFGRTNQKSVTPPEDKWKADMRDQYVLKLTDCGFDSFMSLKGKVITKRDPIISISPPKKVIGKRYLRILNENQRSNEKKFDDIYQMGVILLLLLKGDITRLVRAPIDTERIHNYVTGVDAIYARFDKPEIIQKLIGNKRPDLNLLLRKMMDWEPLLRYDIKQVMDSKWMNALQSSP